MNCPHCHRRIRISRYDGSCRTCGFEYLQPYAVHCLTNWNFLTWPDASGTIPREGPTEGLYCAGKRGPYLFACKRSLHHGTYASFSTTLIGAALASDRKLALFVGTGPYSLTDCTVFDARVVVDEARERTTVDSKREKDVSIFDVHPRHGVPLGDYVAGRVELPGAVEDGWQARFSMVGQA